MPRSRPGRRARPPRSPRSWSSINGPGTARPRTPPTASTPTTPARRRADAVHWNRLDLCGAVERQWNRTSHFRGYLHLDVHGRRDQLQRDWTLLISAMILSRCCLLYTSDAADERSSIDLG